MTCTIYSTAGVEYPKQKLKIDFNLTHYNVKSRLHENGNKALLIEPVLECYDFYLVLIVFATNEIRKD